MDEGYYQRIEASASGVVGNTLGAKGNVFNEWKERSNDFRISLELLDLDEWARAGPEISLQSLIARAGPPGGQTIDFP